jgi:multiple sugar transport system substrate-binding protein
LSKHIPNLVKTYATYKGVLYGIPTLGDAMINMYNVEHFREAGLDPEKPPETWEDLYEMGKRLTREGRFGFALMGARKYQVTCTYSCIFFGLKKVGWYNPDGTAAFDCPEGVQAMTILAEWLTEIAPPAAAAWDIVEATEAVAQATCSMMIQWPGMMPTLVDPEKSKVIGKLGFAMPPLGTALGGHAFGVLSTSRNPDAAYLLIEYLTAPEVQKQWAKDGYAITIESLFDDPEIQQACPWIKAVGEALKVGIGWPTDQDTDAVWQIISKYCNMAVTKELSPAEANAAMVQEINKARKEAGYIK